MAIAAHHDIGSSVKRAGKEFVVRRIDDDRIDATGDSDELSVGPEVSLKKLLDVFRGQLEFGVGQHPQVLVENV